MVLPIAEVIAGVVIAAMAERWRTSHGEAHR